MKKRILSLLAICCTFFVSTSGTNETNNNNNSNESEITIEASEIKDSKGTKGVISFTSAKESGVQDPKYIAVFEAWIYYAGKMASGNTMTITSTTPFSKVIFNTMSTSGLTTDLSKWKTSSEGSYSIKDDVVTWTSNNKVNSVTFNYKGLTGTESGDTGGILIKSFTVNLASDPTVSLTNADPVGGYYKDENGNKKQFVSFGATVTALPEKDLSLVSEYGINVYSDESCSTLVTTKSATIGEGGHTIDELKGKGGRFYTILSSDDGIEDDTKYYAKAYVKESSGASVESSTIMIAEASTSGAEYIL